MSMTTKQVALVGVHSLNTREGFDYIFNYGKRLCDEFYIPERDLPVSLVIADIEDMLYNSESTLPIAPIRNLMQPPF